MFQCSLLNKAIFKCKHLLVVNLEAQHSSRHSKSGAKGVNCRHRTPIARALQEERWRQFHNPTTAAIQWRLNGHTHTQKKGKRDTKKGAVYDRFYDSSRKRLRNSGITGTTVTINCCYCCCYNYKPQRGDCSILFFLFQSPPL